MLWRKWRLNCSFATAPNTHTILYLLTHEAREIIVVHHGIANHGHLDVGYSRLGKGHEAHQGHRHNTRSAARAEDPRRCRGQRHDNPGPQSPKDMVDSAHGSFHFANERARKPFSVATRATKTTTDRAPLCYFSLASSSQGIGTAAALPRIQCVVVVVVVVVVIVPSTKL
jgi:hypothetical protein